MGHPPPSIEDDDLMSMGSNRPGTAGATSDQSMFFRQPQMLPQQPMLPWDMPQNIMQPGMNMFAPAPPPLPGPPRKFYTFQRVNGNGGNGKGDGVPGPHKHTLEESDRVKKNIVMRTLAKNEKKGKKVQVSLTLWRFCMLTLVVFHLLFLRQNICMHELAYDIILMLGRWDAQDDLPRVVTPPRISATIHLTILHVFCLQTSTLGFSSRCKIVLSTHFSCYCWSSEFVSISSDSTSPFPVAFSPIYIIVVRQTDNV